MYLSEYARRDVIDAAAKFTERHGHTPGCFPHTPGRTGRWWYEFEWWVLAPERCPAWVDHEDLWEVAEALRADNQTLARWRARAILKGRGRWTRDGRYIPLEFWED